jgi:hypothetical protein
MQTAFRICTIFPPLPGVNLDARHFFYDFSVFPAEIGITKVEGAVEPDFIVWNLQKSSSIFAPRFL